MYGAIQSLVTVKRGVCTAVIQANGLNKQRKINPSYTVYIYFIIEGCPEGHYGRNCSVPCPYPEYGMQCKKKCNCSEERFKYLYNIQ